jgi:hypothetical protein
LPFKDGLRACGTLRSAYPTLGGQKAL